MVWSVKRGFSPEQGSVPTDGCLGAHEQQLQTYIEKTIIMYNELCLEFESTALDSQPYGPIIEFFGYQNRLLTANQKTTHTSTHAVIIQNQENVVWLKEARLHKLKGLDHDQQGHENLKKS